MTTGSTPKYCDLPPPRRVELYSLAYLFSLQVLDRLLIFFPHNIVDALTGYFLKILLRVEIGFLIVETMRLQLKEVKEPKIATLFLILATLILKIGYK